MTDPWEPADPWADDEDLQVGLAAEDDLTGPQPDPGEHCGHASPCACPNAPEPVMTRAEACRAVAALTSIAKAA